MNRNGVTFIKVCDDSGVFASAGLGSQTDLIGRNTTVRRTLHISPKYPQPHRIGYLDSAPGTFGLDNLDRRSLSQRMDYRGLATGRRTQRQFIQADFGRPEAGSDNDRLFGAFLRRFGIRYFGLCGSRCWGSACGCRSGC